MAECVLLTGVAHTPVFPRRLPRAVEGSREAEIREAFDDMRRRIADASPDMLFVIGADHLNQLFMDSMTPFLVGKASVAVGPFPHESAAFGIPVYETAVDAVCARDLVASGFDHGIDLSYTNEFRLDHSFIVPLTFLRPEQDLPIVPLFVNTMAPPLPSARRVFEVGVALRSAIAELPAGRRVAVISSGHLSSEIGGPRMRDTDEFGRYDGAFDETALSCVADGNVAGLLELATTERMARAGNATAGFLAYVLLVGIAGGTPATLASSIGHVPFFAWDVEARQ